MQGVNLDIIGPPNGELDGRRLSRRRGGKRESERRLLRAINGYVSRTAKRDIRIAVVLLISYLQRHAPLSEHLLTDKYVLYESGRPSVIVAKASWWW